MFPIKPPRKPDSQVVTVLREYRAKMDDSDTALMQRMGRKWLEIERKLDGDIVALAYEMERRAKAGEVITQQMIYKAERYQILKSRLADEIKKYNKDYAVAEISASQEQFATLGISAANDAILASYPGAGALSHSWTRINTRAVENMIGFAGDGSPLYRLLKEDYPDAVDGLTQALVNGLARGLGPAQIGRDMADGMGMGLDRAMLIARTEVARAYRTGSTEQYRASGVVSGFMRLVKKETACLGCLALDGEKFELAEELDDHPRGKAELPDNLIITESPTALETLYHNGDIVIIHTASGKFLPVTPNHPVLTRRGWVAARFVNKLDDIISYGGSDWASGIVTPDKNHVPTRAHDLVRSFDMLRLGSVPEAAKYLYRNGEGSQIDVVYLNRLLWDSFDASERQHLREYFFGISAIGNHSFNPKGTLDFVRFCKWLATNEILRVFYSSPAIYFVNSSPAQYPGLGCSTARNSAELQYSLNNSSGYTELLRDGLLGLPAVVASDNRDSISGRKDDFVLGVFGQFLGLNRRSFGFVPEQPLSLDLIREGLLRSVPMGSSLFEAIASNIVSDRVTEVNFSNFTGHVYSLQNNAEWYISNGIISHNCTAVPIVEGVSPPNWEKGPQWFERQDEATQSRMMGPEKFELWKSGKIKLSDLAKHSHSDIWGDAPRVATMKELTK